MTMNNLKLYIKIAIIALMLVNLNVSAAVINIPDDQPTIQKGIDIARNGDTVLVHSGIYRGTGNVGIMFMGKEITVKSKNGAENTIIDCERKYTAFYFIKSETTKSILDGFTIKNGNSTIFRQGGGIYCDTTAPTIRNCNIYDTINCEAIYAFNSDVEIYDCNISGTKNDNGITFDGFGFLRKTRAKPKIINCNISKNNGNGVVVFRNATVLIQECIVSQNRDRGIAISHHSKGENIITNCIIEKNKGGGVACTKYSILNIRNSIIRNNTAEYGGGISCGPSGIMTVSNCVIANNMATFAGGGIDVTSKSGEATFVNCTITRNTAKRWGGGISVDSQTKFILSKSIVWDNKADVKNPEIFLTGIGIKITSCDIKDGLDSIGVQPDGDQFIYEDNIDADPLFLDPLRGVYGLAPNSPAAGMGAQADNIGPYDVAPIGKRNTTWAEIKAK